MAKIILSIFIMSFSFYTFAENPQLRVCRINGGHFWSYDVEVPKEDNIGFCHFDEALIGSISLIEYLYYGKTTTAVSKFFETRRSFFYSCSEASAQAIEGIDSLDETKNLCLFEDGSFIEEETLLNGFFSSKNRKLRSILLR